MPELRNGASGHILIAEDNRVNQMVARAMLENLGFDVDVVGDGAQAVAAATRTAFQGILMDCQLPVLDGYQATIEIRRHEGLSRRTPVIAVTGAGMSADRQRCLAAGMDELLTKPISLTALTVVLTRWAPFGTGPVIRDTAARESAARFPIASNHRLGPPDPDRAVLDPQVVDRLERLGKTAGKDLITQLARVFLADADARLAEMRNALVHDDATTIILSAHTLSGAGANLGATELARLCANFERYGAARELERGAATLEAIETELGRVRDALSARTPSRMAAP